MNPDFAIEPVARKKCRDFFVQAKSGLTPPPTSRASVGLENLNGAAAHGADFALAKSGVKVSRTGSVLGLIILSFIPNAYCIDELVFDEKVIRSNGDDSCANVDLSPDLTQQPLMTLASNPEISDSCKDFGLHNFGDILPSRYRFHLCRGKQCEQYQEVDNLVGSVVDNRDQSYCLSQINESAPDNVSEDCEVNGDYARVLKQADDLLAQAVGREIDVIEGKIEAGMIPYCVLPPECQTGAGDDCRKALIKKWWEADFIAMGKNRHGLGEGSFEHLLLAGSFTCGMGEQKGGTCSLYSGASLMAHYCVTPAWNPSAKDSCSSGPNFRCVGPEEFLKEAHRRGVWKQMVCKEDSQAGKSQCDPGSMDWEDLVSQTVTAALKNQDKKRGKRLAVSEVLYNPKKIVTDAPVLTGESGVFIEDLVSVYGHYGFGVHVYKNNRMDWARIQKALDVGHPIQVALPTASLGYGAGGDHAVVLEGRWVDERGVQWVLLRDSNPRGYRKKFITAVEASEIHSHYTSAIGLCPPQDQTHCQEK